MNVYDKYFEKVFGASTTNVYVTEEKFDLDDEVSVHTIIVNNKPPVAEEKSNFDEDEKETISSMKKNIFDELGKVSHSSADGESDVKTWDTQDGDEFDAISSSRESLSPLPVCAVCDSSSSSKPSSGRSSPINKEEESSSKPSTGSKDKGTNPDMKENESSNQDDPVKVRKKIPYWARCNEYRTSGLLTLFYPNASMLPSFR